MIYSRFGMISVDHWENEKLLRLKESGGLVKQRLKEQDDHKGKLCIETCREKIPMRMLDCIRDRFYSPRPRSLDLL